MPSEAATATPDAALDTSAADECFFHDPTACEGDWWRCETCGEDFCSAHGNDNAAGVNVECPFCDLSNTPEARR